MTEGYISNASTGKLVGKVDGIGTTIKHKVDALNVTVADPKPKVETVREVRIEYTESLGDAYTSVSVETFMTAKELRRLVRELRKVKQ